jgi:uncharacterized protein YkwD
MRWFCLSLVLVVLSLVVVVSASWPSAAQNKQLTSFELGMLAEHNNVRQKNNVPPLTWDDTLAAAAQDRANRIAAVLARKGFHTVRITTRGGVCL